MERICALGMEACSACVAGLIATKKVYLKSKPALSSQRRLGRQLFFRERNLHERDLEVFVES